MAISSDAYSLADLCRIVDVTPRTVRYYVAQGLLPAPSGAGPAARYGQGHLVRLRLIRKLQRQHMPLADIRIRLAVLSDEDVRGLVEAPSAEPPADESALDYIRSILRSVEPAVPTPTDHVPVPPTQAQRRAYESLGSPGLTALSPRSAASAPSPVFPAEAASGRPTTLADATPRAALDREPHVADLPLSPVSVVPVPGEGKVRSHEQSDEAARSTAVPASGAAGRDHTLLRSQWDRVELAPDVELHIRRPLSRIQNRRVERLIAIARELLEED